MPSQAKTEREKEAKGEVGNPVGWVEIPVNNLERAKTFYTGVFGFTYKMHQLENYKMALINGSPEQNGCGAGLMQGESYVPSYAGAVVYFQTADINASLKKVAQAGGKVLQQKKSIGEYGFIAFFEDCEGNRVALHSMN